MREKSDMERSIYRTQLWMYESLSRPIGQSLD